MALGFVLLADYLLGRRYYASYQHRIRPFFTATDLFGQAALQLSAAWLTAEPFVETGLWEYRSGEMGDWQVADPYELPADWSGYGWFRLRLEVAPDLAGEPLALLYHQHGAGELYVDGVLFRALGKVGSSAQEEELLHYGLLNPLRLQLEPGPHLLEIRYSNFVAANYAKLGFGASFSLSMGRWSDAFVDLERKHARYQIFFTAVPLAFGALHLLLYAFYRRARENLYYALHTVAIAAVSYTVFALNFAAADELLAVARTVRLPMVLIPITGPFARECL